MTVVAVKFSTPYLMVHVFTANFDPSKRPF